MLGTAGKVDTAHFIIKTYARKGQKLKVDLSEANADEYLLMFVQHLLDMGRYDDAATILWGPDVFTLDPHSVQMVWKEMGINAEILVIGAASLGKCLGKGTGVLMHDGSVKPVEDVQKGDLVMGPDSKPRTVTGLHHGRSRLYRVNQCRADSYVVNENHTLTLRCTESKWNNGRKTISKNKTKGVVIDIDVGDYIKSSETFRSHYKGFSVPVEWRRSSVPMDPYIFGMWLGDGTASGRSLGLTSMDSCLVGIWRKHWESMGARIYIANKPGNAASTYIVRDGIGLQKRMAFAIRDGKKFVPHCYKANSREVRLKVLAGFLDTDGYCQAGGYGFTVKNRDIAESMAFIARSLGLTCTLKSRQKKCVNNGVVGTYWRANIHGDCSIVPCVLKKQKRPSRVPIGRKINIEEAGFGEYYGFSVDGDGRFLLGDFTVTHNSYTAAVWLLLDWVRDPEWTCIKVLSVTEEHAKRNVFAHIKNLHRTSRVTLPGDQKDKSIQVGKDDKQGIHLLTIPMGDDGKGRLRGFHPVPRPTPHHQFGKLSRVRAILDEAEEIPEGVWEDVDNILVTKDGVEHVKVFAATNPKDRNSKFGQRCEPMDGWQSVNIETSERWLSRLGWTVVRLDGAKCENVVQRKIVFAGLLTWDGYGRYLALGDTTPSYFTMARGWFPTQGLHANVVPVDFITNCEGSFIFAGETTFCASVDFAASGGDTAPMTIGRWGRVVGWKTKQGKEIRFERPRNGLQVEQQFNLKKGNTLDMAEEVISVSKNLRIPPLWLIVDRTGNGEGIQDALRKNYGPEVVGVHYGEKATELRVLDDDDRKPSELYDGVVTELWFAARRWMEFQYVLFGPALKMTDLTHQLTTRRYKQSKGEKVRVESKDEYKARGNRSPDEADSFTLLIHLVRTRGEFEAVMVEKPRRIEKTARTNPVDKLEFVNFDEEVPDES